MRILLCGGRAFTDHKLLDATLDGLHLRHNDIVIHGAAAGGVRSNRTPATIL